MYMLCISVEYLRHLNRTLIWVFLIILILCVGPVGESTVTSQEKINGKQEIITDECIGY